MYNPDVEEFQGSKSATADELVGIKSSGRGNESRA